MVWDITTSILTSHGFLDLSDPSPDVSKLLRTHFTRAHTVTALQMWIGYKQNESASYEGTQKSEPGSIGTSKAVQVACTCIFPSKNFASYILRNHASWAILISDCGIIYHAPFKSLSGLNAASELDCMHLFSSTSIQSLNKTWIYHCAIAPIHPSADIAAWLGWEKTRSLSNGRGPYCNLWAFAPTQSGQQTG